MSRTLQKSPSQTFSNSIMCVSTAPVELSKQQRTIKKKHKKQKSCPWTIWGNQPLLWCQRGRWDLSRSPLVGLWWLSCAFHPAYTSAPLLTSPQSPASPSSSTRGIKSRALICLLPFWPYRRSQTDRASYEDLRQTPPPPATSHSHRKKKKHSFIRAMFKPLCDIPRTSATRRLSLIHYLIPLLW